MSRDVRLYVADIKEAIGFIRSFTAGMTYAEFVSDTKTQHACIRDLQIIGEAVKKLPDTLRAKYRNVPWRRIAGLRDILTHEYFGVDLKIIWDVIANRLEDVENAIELIENDLPEESNPRPES